MIFGAAKSVGLAIDLILGKPPTAWLAFDSDALGDPEEDIDAVYIDTCELGGAAISYCVKVTLSRNAAKPTEFRSTCFTPLDVRPSVSDLQDYAEEQAELQGVKVLINPENVTHPVGRGREPNDCRSFSACFDVNSRCEEEIWPDTLTIALRCTALPIADRSADVSDLRRTGRAGHRPQRRLPADGDLSR